MNRYYLLVLGVVLASLLVFVPSDFARAEPAIDCYGVTYCRSTSIGTESCPTIADTIPCACPGALSVCVERAPRILCSGEDCAWQEQCQCQQQQCNNGSDDDGDGLTDYPADPGCTNLLDNSEYNATPPPPPVPPTVDLQCAGTNGPCDVAYGATVPLSWSSQNEAVCWTAGGTPDWTANGWDQIAPRDSSGAFGPVTGTVLYTIYCQNNYGTVSDSVQVSPNSPPVPVVDLKCNGFDEPCVVLSGTNVTLSWTSANVTACTASGGWAGAKGLSGSESQGPIVAPVTFTLTCDGVVSDSVTVSPGTPATVDLKCNGADGPCSVPTGGSVALQWTSTNASACTASGGTWAGPRGLTGTESQGPIVANYVYALTCTGAGTAVDYVTVNVQGPRDATCASSTIPTTMLPGETRAVSMTFFNSGTMPWTDPDFDVSQWPWPPSNPSMIPQQFNVLPAGTVNPGGSATYNFNLTAPVTPGVYVGAYRMLEQNVEWFGQTCGQSITVAAEPMASNVTIQDPDYCGPGPVPGAFVSWTYTGSTPQTAYRIQIDDDPAFGSPNFAMGKVMSSNTSLYASGTGLAGWGPVITWGTTYYARVRVYDGGDVASAWTDGTDSWTTPIGPYPVPSFTAVPAKPVAGEPVQFTDGSVCAVGGCEQWTWDFGDGTTDSVQNPSHTYALQGSFTVKLDVADAQAHLCSITKTLNANKAVPFWREVLPW